MRQAVRQFHTNYWAELYNSVQPVLPAFVISRTVVLFVAFVLELLLDTGRIFRYAYLGNALVAPLPAIVELVTP
jgi:hypothetical protein